MTDILTTTGSQDPANNPGASSVPDVNPTNNKPQWFDALGPDLKDSQVLKRYGTLDEFAGAHLSLFKQFSGNKISVPDKHASDQDWKERLDALAKADTTEFKLPDGVDPEFSREFADKAKEAGMLPRQMQKLANWYFEKSKGRLEAQANAEIQATTVAVAQLQKELGQTFEPSVQKARAALNHFGEGIEGVKELLDTTKVGGVPLSSHPVMVKLMLKVSETMKEGTFKGENFLGASLAPDAAVQKANQIIGDMSHPYHNPQHPNHKAALKEVSDLFNIAY